MAGDPYKYFRPEASEILDQFSRGMLDLERNADAATLQRVLRLAHTLKGAARIVKQSDIASHAHAIEDVLSPSRASPERIGPTEIDAVLAHIDAIGAALRNLGGAAEPPNSASGRSELEAMPRTIRAEIAEADALLDSLAEMRVLIGGLRSTADDVDQTSRIADLLAQSLSSVGSAPASERPSALAEELRRRIGSIERALDSAIDRTERELRQLRETAERLRLVPASNLFTALERMAMDTARALGKVVAFTAAGDDVRLDAHVIEALQHALIQIVRNAVAHGIESAADRAIAGKPPTGMLAFNIARRGKRIVFSCSDDGRGLDMERVREVAALRGVAFDAEPNPEELMRLLLRGGISTSRAVTEEAGRGIGLDVVREAVERLGGEVACHSTPGRGTSFELIIPPALVSMEALIVEPGGNDNLIAIPLAAIKATRRTAASELSLTSNGASLLHDDLAIPFVPLAAALDSASWSANRNWATVVVSGAEGLAAIGVERLLGTMSIVTQSLPHFASGGPAIAAAFLDADGNPQLVLDADQLVKAARHGAAASDSKPKRPPVLVVDDSLTTRMLEQSILESAGYDVEVAVSGEDGLERVRTRTFSLILVDVEMPGMNGFTFIERLRSDPKTRNTPAILVTSLAEPSHRQRGRDVGAQGYIVKSEFDQAKLLAMIEPLVA